MIEFYHPMKLYSKGMVTLTQSAVTARKVIRYSLYLLVFLIVGRVLWGVVFGVYRYFFPKPPPAPTVTFGKLPKLTFPDTPKPANISFTLETPTGSLPTLNSQAKVFFMPKISPNLLSLDTAKEKAALLGFKGESQQISPTVYRFANPNAPSTLEMDIVSGAFSISYDLSKDPATLDRRPPAPEIAASQLRSYLSAANLLPDDLSGETSHEFLKVEGTGLTSALSLSDAGLIKIYLFRKSFDNLVSLTTNPAKANVWFLVTGQSSKERQFISGEFHYFPVDEGRSATYPLKTSETAWNEFSGGNYFLASIGANGEGTNIKIRKVYLAYFDAGVPQEFYQPIFVFEGDKGFVGYLPAVTTDYYGE